MELEAAAVPINATPGDSHQQPMLNWEDIVFSRVGMRISKQLDYDEWFRLYGSMDMVNEGSAWAIGDILNYGEKEYGEMYTQAMKSTRRSYTRMAVSKSISATFQYEERKWDLDFGHYEAVASIWRVDRQTASELLDRAESEDLPVPELRHDAKEMRRLMGIGEYAYLKNGHGDSAVCTSDDAEWQSQVHRATNNHAGSAANSIVSGEYTAVPGNGPQQPTSHVSEAPILRVSWMEELLDIVLQLAQAPSFYDTTMMEEPWRKAREFAKKNGLLQE